MSTFSFTLSDPGSSSTSSSDSDPISHETDHAGYALGKLLHQFKDKPRIEDFLENLMDALQTVEDVLWQVSTEVWLDAVPTGEGPAVGTQLDVIGILVGEPRADSVSDDEYRTFLKVRILVNNSDGKIEDLNSILDLIEFDFIRVRELGNCNIEVYLFGATYPTYTAKILNQAKAGGVGLDMIYSSEDRDDVFKFSGTYVTEETSSTSGFASVHATTGGTLAGTI